MDEIPTELSEVFLWTVWRIYCKLFQMSKGFQLHNNFVPIYYALIIILKCHIKFKIDYCNCWYTISISFWHLHKPKQQLLNNKRWIRIVIIPRVIEWCVMLSTSQKHAFNLKLGFIALYVKMQYGKIHPSYLPWEGKECYI